jgi:type I restriction enzyme M protein
MLRLKTTRIATSPRYFCKPQPLSTLEEICAGILTLEKDTGGLFGEIIGWASK